MILKKISELEPGDVFCFAKDASQNPPQFRMTDTWDGTRTRREVVPVDGGRNSVFPYPECPVKVKQ